MKKTHLTSDALVPAVGVVGRAVLDVYDRAALADGHDGLAQQLHELPRLRIHVLHSAPPSTEN